MKFSVFFLRMHLNLRSAEIVGKGEIHVITKLKFLISELMGLV